MAGGRGGGREDVCSGHSQVPCCMLEKRLELEAGAGAGAGQVLDTIARYTSSGIVVHSTRRCGERGWAAT